MRCSTAAGTSRYRWSTWSTRTPLFSSRAGVYFGQLQIDNQEVPVIGADPGVTISPPLLSGHGFDAPNQVVLGALTLAQLHKRVGETVEVRVCRHRHHPVADRGHGHDARIREGPGACIWRWVAGPWLTMS